VPQQNRNEKYTAIPSYPFQQCYFKETDDVLGFDIALGDWGVASWTDKHLTENIQPVALRAPEVLIKAPWDARTDFWNLGAVLLELYRAIRMFSGHVAPDGHYEVREHLAEIVDFLGPFPQALLEKGDQELVQDIFDGEGKVKGRGPMNRPELGSELVMPGLHEETRAEFTSFLRAMMKIDPAERASADDLLRFPWLGALPPKGQSPSQKENSERDETATTA
jgi:serine/threonine-protein kinase SRPK3